MAHVGIPNDYRAEKQLQSASANRVFAGVRIFDGLPVILKIYTDSGIESPADRAKRELEMLRTVAGPGVPVPVELLLDHEEPVLIVEQSSGLSLFEWARRERPAAESVLAVAAQLSTVLERVHAAGIIHRDINPTNAMVNPTTLHTHLVDFGLARRLGSAVRGPREVSGTLEGSLRYVPPEQTGRMNRGCDFRSDLYALGATLYYAVTGRPPFDTADPLELIHAHLARRPRAPLEVRPELPSALSDLILKLLEKEPSDRYQSAAGLRADVEALHRHLQGPASHALPFVLGGSETPQRPTFPSRLFGRKQERETIHAAYARSAAGQPGVVVLVGESGTGKSSLVSELRAEIAATRGYLVSGKFDLARDRPYSGWCQALESFANQLLVTADLLLEQWRAELLEALGPIAGALTELVPDLGFVLGEVPPLPRLGPGETRARLSLALARFVRAAATREHPLVVFLDDLQWSDAGSLSLLEEVLLRAPDAAFLLITAYRSSEVDGEHPVTAWRNRIVAGGVQSCVVSLGPLVREDVGAWLAETLERPRSSLDGLCELIECKAVDTPLLIREFVESLLDSGMLRYWPGQGWIADLDAMRSADAPDGAVELLTRKIERLELDARHLLTFASCVGDEFDVALLCELRQQGASELEPALFALNDAGLLTPCAHGFRFAHDRIREAAREQVSPRERAHLHLDTAKVLLRRSSEPGSPDRTFEIADHLEAGAAEIGEDLRMVAIRASLNAGSRALMAGAERTAERYLSAGRQLFRAADWDTQGALGFELWMQSAESAYQMQAFAEAEAHLSTLEQRPLGTLEQARAVAKRIQVLVLSHGAQRCVEYALRRLRQFGVRWPLHPSRARACWALLRSEWALRSLERSGRDPYRPPTAVDPRWFAPLTLLGASSAALARVDVHLAVLGIARGFGVMLKHGFVVPPGFPIAIHATYMYLLLGRAERARQLASTALEWNVRRPEPPWAGKAEVMIHGFLNPFLMARRSAIAPLPAIARAGDEHGDLEFAAYARLLHGTFLALAGHPVREMHEQLIQDMGVASWLVSNEGEHQEVARAYAQLTMDRFDPAVLEAQLAESERTLSQSSEGAAYTRTIWMMVLTVYDLPRQVLRESDLVGERLWRIVPFAHVVDHTMYRGLAAGQLATRATGRARRRLRRTLNRCRRIVGHWAREGPDFVHMATLLEAEQVRLRGNVSLAARIYERAVREASRQHFLHHAALASERLGRMLAAERRETEAAAHLGKAIERYRTWGALAKADSLANEVGQLRSSRS